MTQRDRSLALPILADTSPRADRLGTQAARQVVFWRLTLIAALFGAGLVVAEVFAEPIRGAIAWGRASLASALGGSPLTPLPESVAPPPPNSPAAQLSQLSKTRPTQVQPLPGSLPQREAALQPSRASASGPVAANVLWARGSFPVENFQGYSSHFGPRDRLGNGSEEFHRGLDLAAPKDSYIRNWWAGRVVAIAEDPLCGTLIRVQSGPWQHVYCHLAGRPEVRQGRKVLRDPSGQFQVSEGQDVPTGARMARVGLSGRTSGPHLHWGVKYGDRWMDPAVILRAMYEQQNRDRPRP